MHIDFPLHFDRRGRTADTDYEDHVRDMVEQLLLTSPGERVNRPDFGCGLLDLLFEGAGAQLTESIRLTIAGALQRWLAEAVEQRELEVSARDSTFVVSLSYAIRATGRVVDVRIPEA